MDIVIDSSFEIGEAFFNTSYLEIPRLNLEDPDMKHTFYRLNGLISG